VTGISFRKWLDDPHGLPTKEPIGLIEIEVLFKSFVGRRKLEYVDWLDGMILCVAALVRRGLRPMLPNYKTGKWEWTDHFNGENGEDDPMTVGGMAIGSWCGNGDSGGALHLRFGTNLPDGPLPERTAYYPHDR
jgi:hypothetical protein